MESGHRQQALGKHLGMTSLNVMGNEFDTRPDCLTNGSDFVFVLTNI
jgi:hypothetical protein